MSELKDMILKTYLKKGTRPAQAKPPKGEQAEPELSSKTPPKPIPVEEPKTLGNITTAMAAQRIYNPQMPPAPKSPTKTMQDQGTGPASGMTGPWGTPPEGALK